VLEEHEWDCAAAVELNRWAHVLGTQMPASFTGLKGAPLGSLLLSANKLRHTSVHRIRIASLETDQLVEAAARLAEVVATIVKGCDECRNIILVANLVQVPSCLRNGIPVSPSKTELFSHCETQNLGIR